MSIAGNGPGSGRGAKLYLVMPRKQVMKNRIRSVADFQKVLHALCVDLGQASDHYTLFRKLIAAQRGPFTKALSQSQTFWSLTYGAHLETAVFRLCRAYDQGTDPLTLRTLIQTIKLRPAFLPVPSPPLDDAELDATLASVSHETSRAVKHLMMWRHKFYAHRDAEKIIGERTLSDEFPITYDDVDALLENGFNIVNRYSVAFFDSSYLRKIVGADDYLKVLRTLQDHEEAVEAKLREEMPRAEGAQ